MLTMDPWVLGLIVVSCGLSSTVSTVAVWLVMRNTSTNLMRMLDRSQKHVLVLSEKPGAVQLAMQELTATPPIGDEIPSWAREFGPTVDEREEALAGDS